MWVDDGSRVGYEAKRYEARSDAARTRKAGANGVAKGQGDSEIHPVGQHEEEEGRDVIAEADRPVCGEWLEGGR